jgi:E3 ubiquitin-protein ligase HUWE1
MVPLVHGFQSMLPLDQLVFSADGLRSIFTGTENVDVEDLIANSELGSWLTPTTPTVQFLWDALRSFSQADLREFLTFVTGSSQVPLGGFKILRGPDGRIMKFQVLRLHPKGNVDLWLPESHTCFNTLVIPMYTSRGVLEQKLRQAMELSRGAFSLL